MSTYLRCDRCGEEEATRGTMIAVKLPGSILPMNRVPLPEKWTRPLLPTEDGELRYKDLCPACKGDLLRFMTGHAVTEDRWPDRPHSCKNCAGMDPDTCLYNPDRKTPESADPCRPGGSCTCPAGGADCAGKTSALDSIA